MVLLAFSLQNEVEKYGAYLGIAAFLGLAVLSLLYFAQAREVRRLRDWAGRAPERAHELEARVVAQAQEARRVQPVTPAASARRPETARSGNVGPAVPAGKPAGGNGRPPAPMGPRPATAAAQVAAAAPANRAEPPAEAEEKAPVAAATAAGAAASQASAAPPAPPDPAWPPPDRTLDDDAELIRVRDTRGEHAQDAGDEDATQARGDDEPGTGETPAAVAAGAVDDDDTVVAAPDAHDAPDDSDAEPVGDADDAEHDDDADHAGDDDDAEPAGVAHDEHENGNRREASVHLETREWDPLQDTGDEDALVDTGDDDALVYTGDEDALVDTGDEDALVHTGDDDAFQDTGDDESLPPVRPAARPVRRPAAALRGPSRSATLPRRPTGPPPRRSRLAVALGVLAGLIFVAAVIFAATQVLDGGGGDETPAPAPNTTAPASGADEATTADRARTDVVVLNGTPINGLASQTREDLVQAKYAGDRIATDNTTDGQQRQASQVLYREGARTQGRDVGKVLGIQDVQPMDPATPIVASSADTESADVVVLIGADRADPAP